MIAASGRFSAASLIAALRSMAGNANPAYDHELRGEGDDLLHDCGWGAAYAEGDGLARRRSTTPCFADPALDSLRDVESRLMILHARRTKYRETIAETNTHPFLARVGNDEWAFCHNGEVRNVSQLSHDPGLAPEGTIDSELLFLHVVTRIDPSDVPGSLAAALAPIHDFTSLNCLLLSARSLTAYARMDPSTPRPRYYTIWRGRASGLDVVSSEIVEGLDVRWERVPDGTAVRLGP
jgi:predicted glutamine amidotransferase